MWYLISRFSHFFLIHKIPLKFCTQIIIVTWIQNVQQAKIPLLNARAGLTNKRYICSFITCSKIPQITDIVDRHCGQSLSHYINFLYYCIFFLVVSWLITQIAGSSNCSPSSSYSTSHTSGVHGASKKEVLPRLHAGLNSCQTITELQTKASLGL